MNEGEYLELVNDLKDQYNDMKETLNKEIAYYKEKLAYIEELLQLRQSSMFNAPQFDSTRPMARSADYVHTAPSLRLYNCRRCAKMHPVEYVCDL